SHRSSRAWPCAAARSRTRRTLDGAARQPSRRRPEPPPRGHRPTFAVRNWTSGTLLQPVYSLFAISERRLANDDVLGCRLILSDRHLQRQRREAFEELRVEPCSIFHVLECAEEILTSWQAAQRERAIRRGGCDADSPRQRSPQCAVRGEEDHGRA